MLACRKLSHSCITIPTCLLSSVAVETCCHDENEEETPPPLHAGMALRFLSSYNTESTINAENLFAIWKALSNSGGHVCSS